MKNFKRLMAALLAVTMICALSVTSFAAVNTTNGYYSWKIDIKNSKGESTTTLTAGETATVSISLVETGSGNGITYEPTASGTPTLTYNASLPAALVVGDVTSTGTDATVTPRTVSGTTLLQVAMNTGSSFSTAPLLSHSFTVGVAGSYTVRIASGSMTDGENTAKAIKTTSVTVTVVEAAAGNKVDDLGVAAAEVKEAFAGKYYITGTAIAGASVEKYVTATDGSKTVSTQRKIGEMINASGSVAVTVVPVLIVSESDAAKSFTFGLADAPISK